MRRFLLLPLLLLTSPVWAGNYSLTLSGDTSAACTISFSTEAESVDGVHPLESGDITAFACTISAASLTLGLSDLQYPIGLDYEVSGGEVVAVELQTSTSNELQIGTAAEDVISPRWYLFGHGTVFVGIGNTAVIAAASAGGSLAEQAATMAPGEWKQLVTANTFDDALISCEDSAAITTAQGGLIPICGSSPAYRVIEAWNSASYDAAENRMFFFGGGHSSYGGNEVYTFDFDTLTWARLTDPEALNVEFFTGAPDYYLPRDVSPADGISDTPGAPHTYDAEVWNPTSGYFLMLPHATTYPSSGSPMANGRFYTFDPDTLAWTPRVSTGVSEFVFGRCEYIPADNETICENGISTSNHKLYTIADDGTFTDCGALSGMNTKLAQIITDASDGKVYDVGTKTIQELTPNGCSTTSANVATGVDTAVGALGSTSTPDMAYWGIGTGINDIWYMWGGNEDIITFDPATQAFDLLPNSAYASTGPQAASNQGEDKVLGKWRCFPVEGVCVGIADPRSARGGWWMWRPPAAGGDVADLGTLTLDGSTQSTMSVHMPILDSDDNNDATAYVEYRETAVGGAYTRGIDLFHQRNDLTDTGDGYPYNPEGLDGMIWGLTPDTEYDIKVTVADPDGYTGTNPQYLSAVSTKALPTTDYTGFGTTEVTTLSEFNSALASACNGSGTGHIIQIPAGTTIDATGPSESPVEVANPTSPNDCGADADNPIVIRGENQATSVLDCSGHSGFYTCMEVKSSYVIIENMTIVGDNDYGIWIYNERAGGCKVHNVAVRDVVIDRVADTVGFGHGVAMGFCDAYDIYVADNTITGPYTYPSTTAGGGEKGIKVSGHDIEVEHNTIDGFVDAMVVDFITNFPVGDPDEEENHSIAFHHNLAPYSADNGFEFDESHRDVIAHDNIFANTANSCLSFQPVRGGPVYAVHNVCYNTGKGPLKFNPLDADPTGMIVWNNTFLKNDNCWNKGTSGTLYHQVNIQNNLFYCAGTATGGYTLNAYGTYDPDTTIFDYNSWNTDNAYEISDGPYTQHGDDFAEWITATQGYGAHDVLTEGETVFKTLVPDFDETAGGYIWGGQYRDPVGKKFDLDSGSSAANGGVVIPGVTPAGDANPAIGACETDECDATLTFYGVR